MKFATKPIIALMFFSIKSFSIITAMEDTADPLVITSDQEKRFLSTRTCETFTKTGTSGTEELDWISTSSGDTLAAYCAVGEADCCNSASMSNVVNANLECRNWKTAADYTICPGSCKDGYGVCKTIARGSTSVKAVEIKSGACSGIDDACNNIGADSNSLTRIEIPAFECSKAVGKCDLCGYSSTFDGAFVATYQCCTGDVKECHASSAPSSLPSVSSVPSNMPSVSQSDSPSAIPSSVPSVSPSTNPTLSIKPSASPTHRPSVKPTLSLIPTPEPSFSPSTPRPTPAPTPKICSLVNCNNGAGKCEAISTTDYKCVCEDTFLNTDNGRNCECPPGFERKSDNRCYDPNVPVPIDQTKSPTKAPTASPTSSPTQTVTFVNTCADDETATFSLNNQDFEVKCEWITKNRKRKQVRKDNYCGLNRVKLICPSSCDFCDCVDDDSYTFQTDNVGTKNCAWLSPGNRVNRETRIAKYCREDFDDGKLLNACTKSCGLCTSE